MKQPQHACASLRGAVRVRQILLALGFLVGLSLLLFDRIAPRLSGPSSEPVPEQQRGTPGYDYVLRGPNDLLKALRHGPELKDAESMNRLVFESLAHGEPQPIRWADNWLARTLGLFLPDLCLTQSPERIARGGRGLCSDAGIVLVALANSAGFRADLVDLHGHVIVQLERGPHSWIADPDYGLVFPGPLDALEQAEGVALVEATLLKLKTPAQRIGEYITALDSSSDNKLVAAGVLNPRLAQVERVLDIMAFLGPFLLSLVCVFFYRYGPDSAPNPTRGA